KNTKKSGVSNGSALFVPTCSSERGWTASAAGRVSINAKDNSMPWQVTPLQVLRDNGSIHDYRCLSFSHVP
ncbi:MAG: hypothetical protein ACLPX5_06900, partial [Dissulfurispiraceae bacterium]